MTVERVRVARHDGPSLQVLGEGGATTAALKPGVEAVPGDWAFVEDGVVVGIAPRTGVLRRRGHDGTEQLLAANVDLVLAVCGLDRPLRAGRLHRTAALAWDAGAVPVVVLTKADVVDDADQAADAAAAALPGCDVHVVAASSGAGLDELRAAVAGRATVLVGESGAGKSTLVNALVGADVAATGAVREGDAKGRHTTTRRELYELPGGGVLLDSPGIRAVGLWVDADSVDAVFPDIEELAERCRFGDCRHTGEPGCAVVAGADPGRLAAWQELRREVESVERTEHERRRDGRKQSRAIKEYKRLKDR